MPEGHVIHRIADALTVLFTGATVRASSPQGRFADGARLIDGTTLLGAFAHGKHLFVEFGDPGADATRTLHVHLGLYGSWSFADAPGGTSADDSWWPPPQGAVRLRLATDRALADLVGPSQCGILTPADVRARRARLGPDPLSDNPSPEEFVRNCRSSQRAIGDLLMDQQVVAGIGNIYRAELLFRHRLHPSTPGSRVSSAKLQRLWSDAVRLMVEGRRAGFIVTTDPGDRLWPEPAGGWTRPAERASDAEADTRWYVFRRTGRPCHRCGTRIAASTRAGRQVYWCRRCQRLPSPSVRRVRG